MSVDVNYFSFSPSRADREWAGIENDIAVLRRKYYFKDESVKLSAKQQDIYDNGGSGLVYADEKSTTEQISIYLIDLDLCLGAERNKYFEEPKMEYEFLDFLVDYFKLKTEDSLPLKSEWLRLYSELTPELLNDIGKKAETLYKWENGNGVFYIKDFLRSVHPVVSDLKNAPDSIFIRCYNWADSIEPLSAEKILKERAVKHQELATYLKNKVA